MARTGSSRTIAVALLVATSATILLTTSATSQDRGMRDDGGRGGGMRDDGGRRGGFATGVGIGIVQGIIANEVNRPHDADGPKAAGTKKVTKEKKKYGKKPPPDEPTPIAHKPNDTPPKTPEKPTDGGVPPVAGPPPTTTDRPNGPGGSVPPTQAGPPPNSGIPPTTDGKKPDDPSDQGKTPPTTYAKTEPESKCGPDITADVLRVLKKIRDDYSSPKTSDETRRKACNSLIDPRTGPNAWDIWGLDPTTGGTPSHPTGFTEEKPADTSPNKPGPNGQPVPNPQPGPHVTEKPWSKPIPGTWFSKISDYCAIPRPQCAATVEFFGTCQHAQVVNYVQFGFMLKLCDGVGYGVYQASMSTLMNAYNLAAYGKFGASSMQSVMANAGVEIEKYLEDPIDQEDIDKYMNEGMNRYIQASDAKIDHGEKQCLLHCPLTDEQKKAVSRQISGYHWEGMTVDSGRR
jgi:hypothetical protein